MKGAIKIALVLNLILVLSAFNGILASLSYSGEYGTMLKKPVTKNFKITNVAGSRTSDYSKNNKCYPDFEQHKIYGSGNAKLIGKFDLVVYYCYKEGMPESSWSGSITDVNGDQILIINEQPSINNTMDENGIWHIENSIVGGTGKFENAIGSISLSGTIDFEKLTWDFTGEGSITY